MVSYNQRMRQCKAEFTDMNCDAYIYIVYIYDAIIIIIQVYQVVFNLTIVWTRIKQEKNMNYQLPLR